MGNSDRPEHASAGEEAAGSSEPPDANAQGEGGAEERRAATSEPRTLDDELRRVVGEPARHGASAQAETPRGDDLRGVPLVRLALTTCAADLLVFATWAGLGCVPLFALVASPLDLPELYLTVTSIASGMLSRDVVWGMTCIAFQMPFHYLISAAASAAALARLRGRPLSYGEAMRQGSARAVRALPAACLAALPVMLGVFALLVPGVILACGLFVVGPVAALERLKPMEVIKRAWALTTGHRGSIFVLLLVLRLVERGVGEAVSRITRSSEPIVYVLLIVLTATILESVGCAGAVVAYARLNPGYADGEKEAIKRAFD